MSSSFPVPFPFQSVYLFVPCLSWYLLVGYPKIPQCIYSFFSYRLQKGLLLYSSTSHSLSPQLAKKIALIPLLYPKYWYFLFLCKFTKTVGHENCHAKFPYFIAEIRVRFCRIEWTLTTDNSIEYAPERIHMQDDLSWWRNDLVFCCNTLDGWIKKVWSFCWRDGQLQLEISRKEGVPVLERMDGACKSFDLSRCPLP